MNDYILLTDSGSDLPADLAERMDLIVLPLTVDVEGKLYRNYLDGREISFKDFYTRLRGGAKVKTSAVNQAQFIEVLEPLLAAGNDVLYLGFDSGISGTYNAGASAIAELAPKYPERKVFAVDTLCASMGQGLIVYLCWKQKQAGKSIEEVRDYCEQTKMSVAHWFTVDDLMHLKRGGRVSAATAIVGSVLNIKPVLHVDDEGHLINMHTARGRKASLRALADHLAQTAIDPAEQTIFISHGDCEQDVEYLCQQLREHTGVKEIVTSFIGPVIGSHAGPGTVALFFLATGR